MGDDLAAFFAKKAQKKNKKKSVVSLDDVGQQLERRLRIQENGENELDENEIKETKSSENVKVTQSSEDSEWIEHIEKPSLVGLTFKEFTENPDELLEENKKRANNDSAKTWQMKSEVSGIEAPKPAQSKTYQTPFARRDARLDISNKEMFPSIAAADEIVEKLKVEEKKKITIAAHPAEEQFQEAKKSRPRAPDESSVNRNTSTTGSSYRSDIESSERTQHRSHRSSVEPSEGRWHNTTPLTSGRTNTATLVPQNDGSNWRSKSSASNHQFKATESSPQEESGNWRSKPSAQKVAPCTTKVSQQNAPTKGKYIPPSLRGKT